MKNLISLLILPLFSFSQTLPVSLINNVAEKKVEVSIGGKAFTAYFYPGADVLKKQVLYPVLSPQGNFITRGWPIDPREGEREDHPHHVGVWLNNGNVNGNDFWNNSNERTGSKNKYGTIVHTSIEKISSGKRTGELVTNSEWNDSEGEVLLKEVSKFVFSGTENLRIIDRTTTLKAVKEVLIADNKEGMFAIRLAKELELPDDKMAYRSTGQYINDFGLKGDDVWGKRSAWMNLMGEINGEKISVAMFDHPENENFPAHWHARGYGLYSVNNIGSEVFTKGNEISDIHLEKGQKITFRYRIVIASKHFSEEEMIGLARDFSK